jgi:hypothetical protein
MGNSALSGAFQKQKFSALKCWERARHQKIEQGESVRANGPRATELVRDMTTQARQSSPRATDWIRNQRLGSPRPVYQPAQKEDARTADWCTNTGLCHTATAPHREYKSVSHNQPHNNNLQPDTQGEICSCSWCDWSTPEIYRLITLLHQKPALELQRALALAWLTCILGMWILFAVAFESSTEPRDCGDTYLKVALFNL